MTKDFVAIDFETANQCRSSVCSVGVVIVKNGKIENSYYSLIRPLPNYYSYWNIQVHGLTAKDTNNAPCFPDVWKEIEPMIKDLPLVAHNCAFDETCLKAVFQAYQLPYPNYRFYCTYRTAQKVLRNALPNFQLQTVAKYCDYDLTNHHHALADAEACAKITVEILEFEN